MALFPLFLKLEGRLCLVVGAGPVGESKISGLLAAGAEVRVVSPSATDRVQAWAAQGRIAWVERRFQPQDLDGAFLVVAALPMGEALTGLFDEARRRGVLCNAVDDPSHCDFYYAAVVKRGELQIAISTNGCSPALAQRIRQELEARFGPEYERWLDELGRVRQALFAVPMDSDDRKRLLHELASVDAFERFVKTTTGVTEVTENHLKDSVSSMSSVVKSSYPPPAARRLPPGKVFLVGAGPGDPELLTLKAHRLLGVADVVLHDDLVPAELLELVPPSVRLQSVGKRHGVAHISQDEINALLVDHARAGLRVVRLKGGDVSIFGRANEEMDALAAAGVEVEIVPGVSAVSGAAAAAAVSLTDRRASSSLILVTAQTCKGNARPDWRALVSAGGTLAIYMPGERYDRIASELLSAGLDARTPCLVVSRASRPDETLVETTLNDLASREHLPDPAIVLVGEVVRRRNTEYGIQNTESRKQNTEAGIQESVAEAEP